MITAILDVKFCLISHLFGRVLSTLYCVELLLGLHPARVCFFRLDLLVTDVQGPGKILHGRTAYMPALLQLCTTLTLLRGFFCW